MKGKRTAGWRDMKRVKKGLLYFYISINADGKGQVERKRLNICKRKSI